MLKRQEQRSTRRKRGTGKQRRTRGNRRRKRRNRRTGKQDKQEETGKGKRKGYKRTTKWYNNKLQLPKPRTAQSIHSVALEPRTSPNGTNDMLFRVYPKFITTFWNHVRLNWLEHILWQHVELSIF